MRSIAPRTGGHEVTFAEEQEEYFPITVAIYQLNENARALLTRWTLTPEERAAVAAGQDIFVSQFNFNDTPMTPMNVEVGPGEWPRR